MVKHVREDVPFVVIIALTVDDIVADVFCKRVGRSTLQFFDVGKGEFHFVSSLYSGLFSHSVMSQE